MLDVAYNSEPDKTFNVVLEIKDILYKNLDMVITIQSLYLKRWLRSKGIHVWRHKKMFSEYTKEVYLLFRLYYDQKHIKFIKSTQ